VNNKIPPSARSFGQSGTYGVIWQLVFKCDIATT